MTSTNPSYKPSDGKREEFRKYLEKTGVMDALTRVLVNLHEEVDKPEDALEYIRDKLAAVAGLETYKQLQTKLSETEERVKELESQLQGEGKTEEPITDAPAAEMSQEKVPTDEPLKLDDAPEENPAPPAENPED